MSVTSKKKGGPYTQKERMVLVGKVLYMHFELGYPATYIAAELNISRHTAHKYIQIEYAELAKDWKESDFDSWLQKELNRLELQRCRLIKHTQTPMSRYSIPYEKLLFAIDSKIIDIVIKTKSQFDKKLSMAPRSQSADKVKEIHKYDPKYLKKLR